MKAFIIYPTYTNIDNKTVIQLYGKLENGQSFVTQNTIKPYFYILSKDLKKISNLLEKYKVEKTNFTNFTEEKVIKISADTQTEINKLHKTIHKKILTYEADVKPHNRFMIDNNLLGAINIQDETHYTSSEKIDRIYENPEITPITKEYNPKLKTISIDIEIDNIGNIICIGIYTENYKKVFMVTKHKLKNTESCKTELECLEKFKSNLIKLDPDIITGWNFIDFDLAHLKSVFQKNKIPFDIGRNNDETKIRLESNFFRSSSAEIPGRQALDSLSLIKDQFIKGSDFLKHAKFESHTLENVSQVILNTGKLIKGRDRHKEILSLYEKNTEKSHQALSDYNLQDCRLVYKILEKTKILELAIERAQLTGLPLNRISGSIAAFDSLYLKEAKSRKLVSPTSIFKNKEERITGGYVQSSKPGIYHNVLILDFKSLYPSIIRTFNIDPASYLEKPGRKSDTIESPNKAYFKNTSGILPEIIKKLHEAREKAKKENKEFASYVIKIMQNSFFGVLANPNCRFFNLKMANAITHFGQAIIKLTAKEIKKLGYNVIYSDTDSVFVVTNLPKTKANALGTKIQKQINRFYKGYVKEQYSRSSFLELEFEKQYLSLLIPKLRSSAGAAKKRYAGLIEKNNKEELEITGLEAIRGDWTEAAQDFQKQLLLKAFHKQPIEKFIKEYVKKIKAGELDSKLIYKKSIRKSLEKYTKTTPPHVKAARQLEKLDSNIIQYYITTKGPEPIQKLKHSIDYDHYIKKQIEPIANQILTLLDKDFDEITQTSKQTKLF